MVPHGNAVGTAARLQYRFLLSALEVAMEILYILIPLSLILLSFAVWAFRWAIKNRQFDDLESPALIPLMDDQIKPKNKP